MDLLKFIDEAAELDIQIKDLIKRFNFLKEKIENEFKNTGLSSMSGEKFIDKISISGKRKDADPEETYNLLRKKKLDHHFIDVVKVQATELKKIIGDDECNSLRPIIGEVIRHSFKKIE